MATGWTELKRFLNLLTPLGADKFLLRSFAGEDGISELFHFHLDLLSEDPDISFDDIIGKNVTFSVRLAAIDAARYFNGYVSRFVQLPGEERLTHYQAEVVPWLWFLTRTADCKIFQNMTVVDIVKKVFTDFGFTDFEDQTQKSYPEWEYCVQYRETAFNFVSRLLEQEGIYYFFKHENGKHTLILGDVPSVHQPCPNVSRVMFDRGAMLEMRHEEDVVYGWKQEQEMRAGKYAVCDYNFETPATRLNAQVNSTINQGGNQRFEIYDYPGIYLKHAEGDILAKTRIEEQEAVHALFFGESDCRTLASGFKFELYGYEHQDQNDNYVLTHIAHHGEEGGFYSGHGSATDSTYKNTFTAIKATVPFRPPRVSPKPLIHGTQTAVVVGPPGEEIYVDKYGRVKVQFHWDRLGKLDASSSCWIRVAEPVAGKGWGGVWTPRINQEVVVSFLEGDPDRPLITGSVYNAVQMPPYALPDEMTKSTFKSYSSKGGGGFNEIRIEDKKGSEQVFIHGERNLDIRVKNDRFEICGGENHVIVEKDHFELSKKDRHVHAKGDHNEKVDGTVSLKAGQNIQVKVGQNYALDAETEIHLKAGMNVVIESGTSLTLKVGGNFVNINSGGIFIKGSMVMINSGGAAGSGAGSSPTGPTDATEADTATPGQAASPPPLPPPLSPVAYSAQAVVLKQAAESGAPFCDT
jgi:type VI secretion system secreted protein VgrG